MATEIFLFDAFRRDDLLSDLPCSIRRFPLNGSDDEPPTDLERTNIKIFGPDRRQVADLLSRGCIFVADSVTSTNTVEIDETREEEVGRFPTLSKVPHDLFMDGSLDIKEVSVSFRAFLSTKTIKVHNGREIRKTVRKELGTFSRREEVPDEAEFVDVPAGFSVARTVKTGFKKNVIKTTTTRDRIILRAPLQ